MKNPISVTSADLSQFGFTGTFDLAQKKIIIDVEDLTILQSLATDLGSISFLVTDPVGFSYPVQNINLSTLDPIEISLSGTFLFGVYTITGTIVDSDGKSFEITLNKNICQPENWNGKEIPGKFDIEVDCRIPRIKFSERSIAAYSGKQPLTTTKEGTLSYPNNTINELDFTSTPFTFGESDGIYTGLYRIRNTTLNTYDLGDNIFVQIPTVTRQDFPVTCASSINEVLCCISDVYQTWVNNPGNVSGTSAKAKLDKIQVDFQMALMKDRVGKDNSEEIARIKSQLNCDCGCDSPSFIEPSLISGGGASNISITGSGGTSVTSETSGSTTQYIVSSKLLSLTKIDTGDLAFSITKSEGPTTIVYAIGFNYAVLANTILNTIAGDEDLLNLLNQMVNSSGGVVLSSIDGGCVIDLDEADYSLSESASALKLVKNIVINGTTYDAPSNLASNDASAVKTWLDSLAKGTFNTSFSGGVLAIITNNNVNEVSTMLFDSNGTPINKLFSKTTGNLSDILQAIIDYICALDTTQVKLSALINLTTISGETTTITPFAIGSELQPFLEALASALSYYANNPLQGAAGTDGDDGVSVQVFVQPAEPTGGTYRNGDIWIVE